MAIKKVLLHVGLQKTATTSIQQTLHHPQNASLLRAKGFFIPWISENRFINLNDVVFNLFSQRPLSYQLNVRRGYDKAAITAQNIRNIELLRKECTENPCETLYISAEIFSLMSEEELENARNFFMQSLSSSISFEIILVLRNPIAYTASKVQQYTNIYPTDYAYRIIVRKELPSLYQNTLRKFSNVFGRENLQIYSFEESITYEAGPVGYHLTKLDFTDEEVKGFSIVRTNEARAGEVIETLDYFNRKWPIVRRTGSLEYCGKPIWSKRSFNDFQPLLNARIPGSPFTLEREKTEKIVSASERDVSWLRNNVGITYAETVRELMDASEKWRPYAWEEGTLAGFENAFETLPSPLKPLYSKFFAEKYRKTGEEKFNALLQGKKGLF